MKILKKILADILGFIVVLLFKRTALEKFDKHVLSIYFHNPSPFLFKGVVRFLNANDFQFISENELIEIISEKKTIGNRKVFISFDDGWKGNLKLIPVIEKYQIPISIFVPVKPVMSGNYWWEFIPFIKAKYPEINSADDLKRMSNSQRMEYMREILPEVDLKRSAINLKELEYLHNHPLVTIGSHTYHHPINIQCNNDELAFEYAESKKTLETWLNTKITSFAYPNGDYDKRDFELLKKNGYQIAFTTNPDITSKNISLLETPRISMNTDGGNNENISRMLGLWHQYIQPLQYKFKSNQKHVTVEVIDQYS